MKNNKRNAITSVNEDDSNHDEDTNKSNNVEPQNGKRIFISPLARKMAEDKTLISLEFKVQVVIIV